MNKEELYNWMKEQGLIKKYKIEEDPRDQQEIKTDPGIKEEHMRWYNSLPEKEKKDFDQSVGPLSS